MSKIRNDGFDLKDLYYTKNNIDELIKLLQERKDKGYTDFEVWCGGYYGEVDWINLEFTKNGK